MYVCGIKKIWLWKYTLEVDARAACASECMLDYTNNPENILTLIYTLSSDLYKISSFVRKDPYFPF